MEPIFNFPAKRDVAGMSALLATVERDQRITVGIETDRYGITLTEGPAWVSEADEMVVGGVHIAKKSALKKDVAMRAPEREIKRVLLESGVAPRGSETDVLSLAHGDFVSIDFEQHPFGEFTVTGVATSGEGSAFVMVGPWIIHNQEATAERVASARLIAAAGEHDMPVPAPRAANFSAVEGDGGL